MAHYASRGNAHTPRRFSTGGTGINRTDVECTLALCIASYTVTYRYTLIYTNATTVAYRYPIVYTNATAVNYCYTLAYCNMFRFRARARVGVRVKRLLRVELGAAASLLPLRLSPLLVRLCGPDRRQSLSGLVEVEATAAFLLLPVCLCSPDCR